MNGTDTTKRSNSIITNGVDTIIFQSLIQLLRKVLTRPTLQKSNSSTTSQTLQSRHLDGIFKPISIIHLFQTPGWHLQAHLRQKSLLQLGQIPGYSSVQSSSTFKFRQAPKPIYTLRYKKIEQGQLSYPKICPCYFSYTKSSQNTKL